MPPANDAIRNSNKRDTDGEEARNSRANQPSTLNSLTDPSNTVAMVNNINQQTLAMILANKLQTGDNLTDTLIAICIMSFVTTILGIINRIDFLHWLHRPYEFLLKLLERPPKKLNSVILESLEYRSQHGGRYNYNELKDNESMIAALLHYVGKHCERLRTSRMYVCHGFGGWFNEDQLDRIGYGHIPTERVQVGDFILEYEETHENLITKDEITTKIRKTIEVSSELSTDKIHAFIEARHQDYVREFFPMDKREYPYHLYPCRELTNKLSRDAANDKTKQETDRHQMARLVYKRNQLNNRTTFASLFFPNKQRLLRRLNDFLRPDNQMSKFTMLLHGLPGGGKTSIIKAVQALSGYDIISVRLNDFRNFEDFFDLFHNPTLKISDGEGIYNTTIPTDKRIIVMDDVDADNDIVHDRKKKEEQEKMMTKAWCKFSGFNPDDSESESSDTEKSASKCDNNGKKGTKSMKAKKAQRKNGTKDLASKPREVGTGGDADADAADADADSSSADSEGSSDDSDSSISESEEVGASSSQSDGGSDNSAGSESKTRSRKSGVSSSSKGNKKSKRDKKKKKKLEMLMRGMKGPWTYEELKLADILNILDGINELNKTIVIMTTNHIEDLDPALIRPGRVNWRQEMTYLKFEDALDILKHYFPVSVKDKNEQGEKNAPENKDKPERSDNDEANEQKVELDTEDPCVQDLVRRVTARKIMVSRFTEFCAHEDDLADAVRNMETFLEAKNDRMTSQTSIRR